METLYLIRSRHSVRQYSDRVIEQDKRNILNNLAQSLNEESGLHIQLVYDEPDCFNSGMARYGRFSGCSNYIAVIGKKEKTLDVKAGYYGEKLVLKAQEIGLNTCWVGLTHGKCRIPLDYGEKLAIIIALGYGLTQGSMHKSKKFEDVSESLGNVPDWYRSGVDAALLAPTAMNRQGFRFILRDGDAHARSIAGPYSEVDLGIVKCHFELVSRHTASTMLF